MSKKNNQASTKEFVENAWLNLGKELPHHVLIPSAFGERSKFAEDKPINELLELLSNPDNFYFTIKHVFNIELLPFQLAILKQLWTRKYPLFVGSRGAGKSFMLGLYAMLRAFLQQGCKIIIVGAAFRQAKVVFEYCEKIWNEAPVLRSICGTSGRSGPRRDIDRCTCTVGDSLIIALPLGDGTKIRGQRANYIIADEFASIPEEIYENVVSGFAAVSANPVKEVKKMARIQALKDLGLWNKEQQEYEDKGSMGNQAILSGTAYYDFNHFSKYWKRYKQFILSRGNPDKLKEFYPEGVPASFNYKDYVVIRMPVELLPKGFMDDKHVARSKATVHSGIYKMEFGASVNLGTKIITKDGLKKIEDICLGDYVLTHKGRFKKVLSKYIDVHTQYNVELSHYGYNNNTYLASTHPVLSGENWINADSVDKVEFPIFNDYTNLSEISLKDICNNYIVRDNYLYPKSSQSILSQENIEDIISSNLTKKQLSIKYNVSVNAISYVLSNKNKPKNALPQNIKLDYDFGLVCGYYAAEGSIVSNGRAVSFALDGHINTKLESYVNQLCDSIRKVFGFDPKIYKKQKNTLEVNINSVLASQLFSYICPGLSGDKRLINELVYSNKEFAKGFITGYCNGDGHISETSSLVNFHSKSFELLLQVKLLLTSFNIHSSILEHEYSNLNLYGKNSKLFLKEFYNKDIVVSDKELLFKVKSNQLVYNNTVNFDLEVEDDHSYCTPGMILHNCFATDSNGFFKRSLIESCVTTNPINDIQFHAELRGNPRKKYIFGIDPASENDNFSIVILEVNDTHRRIVYSWTTTRTTHKERVKNGMAGEQDFYGFCARKIRDLMKVFPCERLVMDAQGGGVAVEEALHDSDKLNEGEVPIWQIIEDDIQKDSDNYPGMHILQMVQFAKADWVRDANHGLRKDFEDKAILFPFFDPLSIGFAIEDDKRTSRLYDTLEDCVLEIEELKDELATIVHTQTGTSGRDKWDTPEVKMPGGKKGRLRKDRYSALLIANMVARTLQRTPDAPSYNAVGGFANQISKHNSSTQMYMGNQGWNIAGNIYRTVKRGV